MRTIHRSNETCTKFSIMHAANNACTGRLVGPAKKAILSEELFSVSLAGSPRQPLTQAVGQKERVGTDE